MTSHPKFLVLKRRIGEIAAEVVLRLWGHCQQNQRGEFWPGADGEYVEVVCGWAGEAGALFKALTESVNKRPGWIVVEVLPDGTQGIRVHDWNESNRSLIHNWKNGPKGGRPKKEPGANPVTGHGLTGGNPRVSTSEPKGKAIDREIDREERVPATTSVVGQGGGEKSAPTSVGEILDGDEPHIPSVEEVVAYGKSRLGDEIPEEYCRHFHRERTKGDSWLNRNGGLRKWRMDLDDWWKKDRAQWFRKGTSVPATTEELTARLEVERDPEARQAIREQIKAMEAAA